MTLVMTLPFALSRLDAETDEFLVALAKRGQADAFDELVRRHAPRLHAVAARMVGKVEAHDVVQEAFIAAFRALPGFREEAKFATWLHRIAMNCSYAVLRKPKPEAIENENVAVEHRSPVLEAERRDLAFALDAALQKIGPEFRETFLLIEYGGLDYAEAAQTLGVQPGTVKSRMSRARAGLREILEAQGYRP